MHLWGWDRRKRQKEHLLLTASGGLKALTISICILNFIKWVEHRSLWINVETTFIRRLKIKQYPTSDFQICTKLIQHQCPTLTQRWINVAEHWYKSSSTLRNIVSLLFQCWYNIMSTLFQLGLNVSYSYIETNPANKKYGTAVIFIQS